MYGTPPWAMIAPRVPRHLQTLGILWCVYGGYRLVGGVIGMFVLGTVSHNLGDSRWNFSAPAAIYAPHWLAALIPIIAVYTAVITALSFFVGFSLLTRKSWGRVLAIVVGVMSLIKPFLGTALGIYTLWVLAPGASGVEYDAIADHS